MGEKRIKKQKGQELEAFSFRDKMRIEYNNHRIGKNGEEFVKKFPTPKHYLYWNSFFWFHVELILQTEKWQNFIEYDKHWEIARFYEEAVVICEEKHGFAGDVEKLRKFNKADNFILEVSRDTFKSTFAKSLLIWVMAKHPDWRNAYVRSIFEDSSKGIKNIADHLIANTKLHSYFPHLKIDPKDVKKKRMTYNRKGISLPNARFEEEEELEYAIAKKEEFTAENTIEAWGLDVTVTGAHVDGVLVFDDAVTEKNYASENIQNKLWGRMSELSSNIASEECVQMYVGTPYADYDVLQRKKKTLRELEEEERKLGHDTRYITYCEQPLLQKEGYKPQELLQMVISPKNKEEYRTGCSSIMFPKRHTPRSIKRKYKEMGKRFYYSQYLLRVISDEQVTFKNEWLTWYGVGTETPEAPERNQLRVIAIIDPSGGNDKDSDATGILIGGIDKKLNIWILEAFQERLTTGGLMERIIAIDSIYRPDEWYMESYAMANKYRGVIQQYLNTRKFRIGIREIKGGTTAGAKYDRIEGSTWAFEMRKVYVQERFTAFIKQYKKWHRGANIEDHLLDCMGYLTKMVYSKNTPKLEEDYVVNDGSYRDIDIRKIKEIKHINKRLKMDNRGVFAPCTRCGKMNSYSNNVCVHCGGNIKIINRRNVSMFSEAGVLN